MSERVCVCCGFASSNRHLFKRAATEKPSMFKRTEDFWICRSYWQCIERGRNA